MRLMEVERVSSLLQRVYTSKMTPRIRGILSPGEYVGREMPH